MWQNLISLVLYNGTMKLAILGCIALLAVSSSPAWAAFDSDGNYYCNSSNLPLEETIYKSSVDKIDSDLNSYLSLNPSASDQELHNYLISDPEVAQPYSIMEQSKACLQSNGISPGSVAAPSPLFLEVFAAPEFVVSGLVFCITMAIVIVLQNKINRSELLKI
jgi:hypothetical protein